jgi:hypothetical protein
MARPPASVDVSSAAARERKTRSRRRARARARLVQVAREQVGRLLAERHDPLLAALAADVELLAVEVDVGEVEPDRLRRAEARGVHELDERAVAQRERAVALERLERASTSAGFGVSGRRRCGAARASASGRCAARA